MKFFLTSYDKATDELVEQLPLTADVSKDVKTLGNFVDGVDCVDVGEALLGIFQRHDYILEAKNVNYVIERLQP